MAEGVCCLNSLRLNPVLPGTPVGAPTPLRHWLPLQRSHAHELVSISEDAELGMFRTDRLTVFDPGRHPKAACRRESVDPEMHGTFSPMKVERKLIRLSNLLGC